MFGNSDVGASWHDWDLLGTITADEDHSIWRISNPASSTMGSFYWGPSRRWVCTGLVLKFALKITNKVLYSRRVSHYVVISSRRDGWDSTRFKAVNTITFYCSERVLQTRSNALARMYKPHVNFHIPLLLKGAMTRKRKLNNKETKILWNMKITYNKWSWTQLVIKQSKTQNWS